MTIKDLEKELIAKGGNLSGIYKITRKSDGKIYIGQSECIVKRILQHIKNESETNSEKIDGAIAAAVDKINDFDYSIELALPQLSTEQLWAAECKYIAQYDSYNKGFNKTKGNHIGKYDHDVFVRKNVVSADITKFIRDHFKIDYSNKKVLLINLFADDFVGALKFNDCEVIQISKYFDNPTDLGTYIMEELNNYFNMKFDLIIANPPYGKVGANITKTIIDNIEYDEYINLLPANDYSRNDTKDLYKYADIDSMAAINKGFSDAAVTTHVARINKKPHRYISWEEFQIENYIDESLTKYFYVTINRKHYAIDSACWPGWKHEFVNMLSPDTTFIIWQRDVSHGHMPYTKKCKTFQWNVLKAFDANWFEQNCINTQGISSAALLTFNTAEEKNNFTEWFYSTEGFRFISKVFTAVNVNSGVYSLYRILPKVDWTRSWTVEEILADYGYAQKEIDEVIADLPNFRGMDD